MTMSNPGVTGLISHWTLNESESTDDRADSYRNHPFLSNSAGWSPYGRNGSAFFNGTNSLYNPNHADFQMGGSAIPFSLGVWIRPWDLSNNPRVFSKWTDGGDKEYQIYFDTSQAVFVVNYLSTNYTVTASNFGAISIDYWSWHFVAAYFDPTGPTIGIAVDDVWNTATGPSQVNTYGNNLFLARNSTGSQNFSGALDEAFLYKNRALSTSEFSWWYNGGIGRDFEELLESESPVAPDSNPTAYWALDETTGTRYDSNPVTNIDLTASNVGYDVGVRGNAASFNGTSSYLTVTDVLLQTYTGGLSIACWIKPTSLSDSYIISKWSTAAQEYVLTITSSKIRFWVHNGSTLYYVDSSTFGTLSTGNWYFVTAFWNPTDDTVNVGVNLIWDSAAGPTSINTTTQAFYIGRDVDGGPYYGGLVDEVAIWTQYALTKGEFRWMYYYGYGRRYADLKPVSPPTVTPTLPRMGDAIYCFELDPDTVATFKITEVITDYYSIIWTERYNELGDFELELPFSYLTNTAIKKGSFLHMRSSRSNMVITDIKQNTDDDGKKSILVTGYSFESLLGRRVTVDYYDYSGPSEYLIYNLVYDNLTNPGLDSRKISIFDSEIPAMLLSTQYTDHIDPINLLEIIQKICKAGSLGFKVVIEDIQETYAKAYFYVYDGVDRSTSQSDNSYVIFSDKFQNLLSSSYYSSDKAKVNVTLMVTTEQEEDISAALERIYIWKENTLEPTELDRYETVGTLEIDRDSGETRLNDAELFSVIQTKGYEIITDYESESGFEGDIDASYGTFIYDVDFFIGDIVQCEIDNLESRARIIEAVRSYNTEGIKTFVTLEFLD